MSSSGDRQSDSAIEKGRSLSEVIDALTSEFARASVSRDVSDAYWRQIYRDHPILAESEPSRVRVMAAKVSLPVAIEEIEAPVVQDTGLTVSQISSVLGARFSAKEREQFALQIHTKLELKAQHFYQNKYLARDLVRVANKVIPAFDLQHDLDRDKLHQLQQSFSTEPLRRVTTRFLYAAADLEQLRPESIIRLELTIGID